MFNEKGCLENLKRIVSEYADDENINNLSLDELRSSYTKIADNDYSISVSNRLKYKSMLWNIDHLKPDIRSRFQTQLFDTWRSIYLKSEKADPTQDRPEINKQTSTLVEETERSPNVDTKEPISVITEQQPIENEKKAASGEDAGLNRKVKPTKEKSPIKVAKTSAPQFENDWFDKLLDFFAVIIGTVTGIVDH